MSNYLVNPGILPLAAAVVAPYIVVPPACHAKPVWSGGHHLLMAGPAGSGKTMLATRLSGLLPALSPDEALEVAKVHSAAGIELVSGGPVQGPPRDRPGDHRKRR